MRQGEHAAPPPASASAARRGTTLSRLRPWGSACSAPSPLPRATASRRTRCSGWQSSTSTCTTAMVGSLTHGLPPAPSHPSPSPISTTPALPTPTPGRPPPFPSSPHPSPYPRFPPLPLPSPYLTSPAHQPDWLGRLLLAFGIGECCARITQSQPHSRRFVVVGGQNVMGRAVRCRHSRQLLWRPGHLVRVIPSSGSLPLHRRTARDGIRRRRGGVHQSAAAWCTLCLCLRAGDASLTHANTTLAHIAGVFRRLVTRPQTRRHRCTEKCMFAADICSLVARGGGGGGGGPVQAPGIFL